MVCACHRCTLKLIINTNHKFPLKGEMDMRFPIFLAQIGTEFIRGVSGGERKRTNIGMELIIEPKVLFLDEPTTGLDAHTAVSVVQLVKE